jgi:hypothetical protein
MQTSKRKLLTLGVRLRYLRLAFLLGTSFFAASAHAEWSYWSASAVTAVPELLETGDIHSFTVSNSPHGRGIKSKRIIGPRFQPIPARLFLPVTAPTGSYFDTIWLRAQDNVQGGSVTASLYRQPVDPSGALVNNAGPAEILGSVTTQNVVTPSDGFQVVSASFKEPVTLNPALFSYYIELKLLVPVVTTIDSGVDITAYDVGLQTSPEDAAVCFDGIDNDGDGQIDCDDADCFGPCFI